MAATGSCRRATEKMASGAVCSPAPLAQPDPQGISLFLILVVIVVIIIAVIVSVTPRAVSDATAAADQLAVDVEIVHHGEAYAVRIVRRRSRVRALVEDQLDADDPASRRDWR